MWVPKELFDTIVALICTATSSGIRVDVDFRFSVGLMNRVSQDHTTPSDYFKIKTSPNKYSSLFVSNTYLFSILSIFCNISAQSETQKTCRQICGDTANNTRMFRLNSMQLHCWASERRIKLNFNEHCRKICVWGSFRVKQTNKQAICSGFLIDYLNANHACITSALWSASDLLHC